jgi:DNA-binding HxlR family transcriptional regulator
MANSDTKTTLLQILAKDTNSQRPTDLARILGISTQALHRHLKTLLEEGEIVRLGSPPKVFYKLPQEKKVQNLSNLSQDQVGFIDKNFSELRATGELTKGIHAFQLWLKRTKQEKAYVSLANSFISQCEKADLFRDDNGFIDLTQKIKVALEICYLEKVVCQNFYSLPQFGKTYLGNLLTAAKSGQNRKCLLELNELFEPYLNKFIDMHDIDALVWAPHSIPRKLMIMDQIRLRYNLSLPEIKAVKIFSGGIPVAQKSLSKLSERIENARETIQIQATPRGKFKHVLIIDDAVGSGATLNEIASKVQKQYNPLKIYGMAIVGSYKGFDVISVV